MCIGQLVRRGCSTQHPFFFIHSRESLMSIINPKILSSNLLIFFSDLLIFRILRTSDPPGGRFTSPLTPLLATGSPNFLALGPPRNLLFSMPIFTSIFDDILELCWTLFMPPEKIRSESGPSLFRFFPDLDFGIDFDGFSLILQKF